MHVNDISTEKKKYFSFQKQLKTWSLAHITQDTFENYRF